MRGTKFNFKDWACEQGIKILDFLYWRVVLVKAQLVALLLRLSDTLKSIIRFKLTWGKNYLGNAENVIFRGPGVSILPS